MRTVQLTGVRRPLLNTPLLTMTQDKPVRTSDDTLRATVRGHVQGVFFRAFVQEAAERLGLVSGSQLSWIRRGRLDREVVTKEAVLNEGDEVYTGRDTEANMSLFDGSTVRLSFNTHIKLNSLRTSRFFSSRKEVELRID